MSRTRRGAAAVEFVLTLPILWLLLMVLLEMAMLWEDQRGLTRATLSVARALSVMSDDADGDALAEVLLAEQGLDPAGLVEVDVQRDADDVTVRLSVLYDPLIAVWPQGQGAGSLPSELSAAVVYPRQDLQP